MLYSNPIAHGGHTPYFTSPSVTPFPAMENVHTVAGGSPCRTGVLGVGAAACRVARRARSAASSRLHARPTSSSPMRIGPDTPDGSHRAGRPQFSPR